MRRNFTNSQKAEMNRRATDATGQLRCEGCGRALKKGEAEHDHVIPEALRPEADKQKPLTIADGQVLGRDCCHRPAEGGKTRADVSKIAKAKRNEAKANSFKPPKQTIPNRGFAQTSSKRKQHPIPMPQRKKPMFRKAST